MKIYFSKNYLILFIIVCIKCNQLFCQKLDSGCEDQFNDGINFKGSAFNLKVLSHSDDGFIYYCNPALNALNYSSGIYHFYGITGPQDEWYMVNSVINMGKYGAFSFDFSHYKTDLYLVKLNDVRDAINENYVLNRYLFSYSRMINNRLAIGANIRFYRFKTFPEMKKYQTVDLGILYSLATDQKFFKDMLISFSVNNLYSEPILFLRKRENYSRTIRFCAIKEFKIKYGIFSLVGDVEKTTSFANYNFGIDFYTKNIVGVQAAYSFNEEYDNHSVTIGLRAMIKKFQIDCFYRISRTYLFIPSAVISLGYNFNLPI